MLQDLWNDVVIPALITLATGTLTILVGVAISAVRRWADKLEAEWAQNVMAEVAAAAERAVLAVNQTFVDEVRLARQDGKLTLEESRTAAQKALVIAKNQLGSDLFAALIKVVGGEAKADHVLLDLIESAVSSTKLASNQAKVAKG